MTKVLLLLLVLFVIFHLGIQLCQDTYVHILSVETVELCTLYFNLVLDEPTWVFI